MRYVQATYLVEVRSAYMIAERILAGARARSEETALHFLRPDQPSPGSRWSYARLGDEIGRCRDVLASMVAPLNLVAVVMRPDGESVAALLAAESLSCPAILLPASTEPEEQASLILEHGVAAVFDRSSSIDDPSLPQSEWIALARTRGTRRRHVSERDMELFVFQLTSGSSGPSRLAARTRAGILLEIEAVTERIHLGEGDTILCASAISHSYGLVGGLLAPLSIGASVVLSPGPTQVSNVVHIAKPSVLFGLASTYIQLLSRVDRSALAPLRLALSAGAALPFGLYEEVLSRFQLPIRQDYGTTETGTISIDFDRAPAPHSVGHVLPHLDVRLSAPRNARLEGFERGEIQVRSPAVTPGYLEQGVLVPATDEEGWYGTRDLGGWDADGCLLVGRRVRDPVLVAGVSVPLEEVERALARLPGVRDVVALQALDVLGRTIIKAIVVAPELDFETVSRWSHDHLAPTHQPSSIELKSELPRSPAGKILHKYLVNSA